MMFSFECGGWFWRRDAEIALLKSADVRLPRGLAEKEMRRLLLEANFEWSHKRIQIMIY